MNKCKLFCIATTSTLCILFFAACSSKATKEDTAVKKDTFQPSIVSTPTNSWPLLLNDSSFLNKKPLSAADVISFKKVTDTLKEDWEINSFLRIDSLKKQKKYKTYLESLDIAQMKEAKAFIIDTLILGSCNVFVWGIQYSSYEACPYFNGNKIYLTSLSKNQAPMHTIALLHTTSSGDAPYYAFTNGSCTIFEGGMINCSDSTKQGGEMITKGTKEVEQVTKYSSTRKYKIESQGFIREIENNKSPERTTYQ